jgi:DNA end-binding protein Ku
MVVVPVRLYPAVRRKVVRFRELDRSGRRVRHLRVSEPDAGWTPPSQAPEPRELQDAPRFEPTSAPRFERADRPPPTVDEPAPPEVAFEEIRKGYEVAPGEYVTLTREEVAALAPERSRAIDVQQFVDVSSVDPIYFQSSYHVVPDRDWVAPFHLLRRTMAEADRMAIAWFTLRSRRYLCAVRAFGDLMLLTTMLHADEIMPADFGVSDAESAPSEKETKMARLLIDTLSGPFEPERYPDEHRRRVLEAIEAKTPSAAPNLTPPPATRVVDLMAALEASVKAAKAARGEDDRQTKPRRRRSTA